MINSYQISRIARDAADVEDVVLEENIFESATFRKIFRGTILKNNPKDLTATVRGYIIVQRKGPRDEWVDVDGIKLNELKKNEGIKLELGSTVIKKLFEALTNLYNVAKLELPWLKENYVVAKEDEIIRVDSKRREFVRQLLAQEYGDEVWKQLVQEKPQLATRLAYSRIQTERESALQEFKQSLAENKDEWYWQQFFQKNEWIFGLGLRYQYLNLITNQPDYGGTNVYGSGAQRGDYLMDTAADSKFTVLVEIKKPQTPLLGGQYRTSGVWNIGSELVGGVSQIQVNAHEWEIEGSRTDTNREILIKTTTCKPKGLLIVGHLNQLDTSDKKKAFELYRRNLINPEIVTFDELYQRAEFIVSNGSFSSDSEEIVKTVETEEEKIPF